MGSTRLPGKVLKNFCGEPMLKFQIKLLQKYGFGFDVVVATTINKKDGEIVKFCNDNIIKCVIGSEDNVFSRYCKVAEKYNYDNIIRLTADNPLVSYSILKNAITSHIDKKPDLTSTREILFDGSVKRYIPKGLSVDIINTKTLLSINRENLNNFEKEHVIPVFYNGDYKVNVLKSDMDYKGDMSIDTLNDFNRIQGFTNSLIKENNLYRFLGYE